jgi:N-acyl-D-amino-acid deacylase
MKAYPWCAVLVALAIQLEPGRTLAADFDLVIANGRVVDGTGSPWFRADVGVRGDRIAAIGDLSASSAGRRIDVNGQTVAPGFIDMLGQSELTLLIDPRNESKIRQGITTEVTGEGQSAAPMNDAWIAESKPWLDKYGLIVDWTDLEGYWRRLREARPAVNLATFVGAAQVRGVVLGLGDVQPTPEQLALMEAEVEKGMRQGALGVSAALIYPPGSYARTPELVALARAAARHGGVYVTHIRGEGDDVLKALEEAITIGREARIPVEVWHLKVAGRKNWGRMKQVIARIERARAEGIDIAANVYPYVASSNNLSADVPEWAQAGGVADMIRRFHDPKDRPRILNEIRRGFREGTPPRDILLVSCVNPALVGYMGHRLDDVAREMRKPPEEALLAIVEADRGQTLRVDFAMSEPDVVLAMRQPWVSFDTDASGQATDGPFAKDGTHPRAFGTMPRILGRYVREQRVMTLEEAVRKMTSLPAQRMHLLDRGILRPGMAADVAVFDTARIRDVATFEDPLRYAEGVSFVVVNGKVVLDSGVMTGERPGRPLPAVPSRPGTSSADPVRQSPHLYTVRLENDRVRVLEYRLKPGEKEPVHSHPPGVVLYLSDAVFGAMGPDGKPFETKVNNGQVSWREFTTHDANNVGTTEAHAYAVELKQNCAR